MRSLCLVGCVVAMACLQNSNGQSIPEDQPSAEAMAQEDMPTDPQALQEAFELDLPTDGKIRDPFWPIGYTPEESTSTQQVASATSTIDTNKVKAPVVDTSQHRELLKKKIAVQGILKQGDQLAAIINNRSVTQGEIVSVQVEGVTYRYVVRTLTQDNVVLEPVADDTKPSSQTMQEGYH